jgi:ubiquinone/menaquinone biosynthesis C-methylase UbiE
MERHLPLEGRVLDAGCGVGRWFQLTAPGRLLTGMDFSTPMVERARASSPGVEVILGDVREIPAPEASFDAAYTVKVLQCLRSEERPLAVAELFRVTAPGGVVVLFEKTRGADGSPAQEWLRWAEHAGGRLVEWHANGYALLDRAITGLVALVRRSPRAHVPRSSVAPGEGSRSLAEHRPRLSTAYMRVRALALGASFAAEPMAERVLPRRWAEHGIFVFTK